MGIFSGGEVSRDEFDRLVRRIEELERRLAMVSAGHLPPPATGPAPVLSAPGHDFGRVLELKQRGKKIEAIKAYRELTNVGLKEAKEAVERM